MTARPSGSSSVPRACFHPQARWLAETLPPDFRVSERAAPPGDEPGFYLWIVDDHMELRRGGERRGVWIDLAELARRSAQGSDLARACGAGEPGLRVLDAMAGWGVDGLVLASRGCEVTLVERQPLLVALQRDLVRRVGAGTVSCRLGDGYAALAAQGVWDVVYLDPMFPVRRKAALPNKRMQWLADLAEPDSRPLQQWLKAARAVAGTRVVLKRRRKDPVISRPDWQILGRTVRYDVYRATP